MIVRGNAPYILSHSKGNIMFKAALFVVILTMIIAISLGDALGTTIQHHMVTRLLTSM